MTDPVPENWTEVERPPHVVAEYDPRQPTLFEHGERDLAVHVLPGATRPTGAGGGETDSWRVGLVRGSATEFEAVEPVAAAVEGRDRALALARQVMRACTRYPDLSLDELADRIRCHADPLAVHEGEESAAAD